MIKDYIRDIPNAERRFFAPGLQIVKAEAHAADAADTRTVRGYAAVFNSDSEVFFDSWVERIAPGAFDQVLDDNVVALFNHDPNLVLARNKKTLRIGVDATGLWYEFSAPNTTAGNDLLTNIGLGNIEASSFAFIAKEVKWTNGDKGQLDVRTIMKVERLYDVSPVTYPAYPDTSVGQRSYQALLQEREQSTKRYLVDLMKRRHALLMTD
jgi:hypothetical protein